MSDESVVILRPNTQIDLALEEVDDPEAINNRLIEQAIADTVERITRQRND